MLQHEACPLAEVLPENCALRTHLPRPTCCLPPREIKRKPNVIWVAQASPALSTPWCLYLNLIFLCVPHLLPLIEPWIPSEDTTAPVVLTSGSYYFSSILCSHVWRRCRFSLTLLWFQPTLSISSLKSCISESHVITMPHTHCSRLVAILCWRLFSPSLPEMICSHSLLSNPSHFLSQWALLSTSLRK